MLTLGIDPGTAIVGYGFVREHEALLVRRGESQFDIIPFDYQLGQGDVDITIPVAHP